jgi:selenocysteine lyase/cysteine desulfurase
MDPLLSRRALLGALGVAAAAPLVASADTFTADRVPAPSRELWQWLRAQLVLDPGLAWLDTATFGPSLRAALVREYRNLEQQSLDFQSYANVDALAVTREALVAAGRFLGADPGDLVLTGGARAGLGIVAGGLDLQPGDEVLTTEHDHPAAVYAWLAQAKRRGIRVVQLPHSPAPAAPEAIVGRFAAAVTPRTRVLLVSHVQYTDGTVMPIRELCMLARMNGVFSVVDGAQAAGQLDVRIPELGCDAYATCLHKWLNGPAGTGLLYLRRDAQARVWPVTPESNAGWDTVDRYGAPDAPVADPLLVAQTRFGGTLARRAPSIAAMPLAFECQFAMGSARIGMRIRELATHLRGALARVAGIEVVTPAHPALAAGIVSFRVPNRDSRALAEALLREDRIAVGHVRHGAAFDVIRVSAHPATDLSDLDRCVAAVQRRI